MLEAAAMKIRPAFLRALLAGFTAPAMLYAPPPSYTAMIGDFSVAGSFARVGALLSAVARKGA